MKLLLYGVVDDRAGGDLPSEGIDRRPLRRLSHHGLAAVVSERSDALASSEQALLDYEQVVERLMAATPLLPARFGTLIEGASAVTRLLDERRQEFATALDRVRGAVELGLRGEWLRECHGPVPEGPAAGTAYMQSRLAEQRRSRALAVQIELAFADITRASAVKPPADSATAVSAAYLVAAGDVDEFLRRLKELESSQEDVTFLCTGPWPPYSFTGAEGR